ncbi:unnamed protein product [Zymoseptoria tritici ST99CH_3D7]|uniref:MIF4G domain-containing protein n=1 Tax=Zymoseptoria tritici (strain ST99CH_3D7) TaxID=1276538 RepID=A0A1X7RNM7_ZYMT9|nr:unnamed protein product [Zymoseptoria tritici ST99CH_3D7]
MTSALPASSQNSASAASHARNSSNNSGTTTPSSGAVPAQLPVRSYASATKTATPPTSVGASAPPQHAKSAADSQMNGNMAQGGSQPTHNGIANGSSDHSRKPSVVINASGASGSYPNGGPVGQNGRPAISFGSMNAPSAESPANVSSQPQNTSLPTPSRDPRVTSPAHSPSPIPQPAASGGRPPANLPGQNNAVLNFGAMPADTEMMRGQHPSGAMGNLPMHERRASSQSMQSEVSNQGMNPNMNRQNFQPQGRGSGRGYQQGQQFMSSPGPSFRNMNNQPGRPNMPPAFQQGQAPGSPFNRPAARGSPSPMPAQPNMQQGHMGPNHQMQYPGYPHHLNPQQQHQQMYGMPSYDPNQGYYQPYYYPGYGQQQAPQSPRPQYPSPFPGAPGAGMQAPFHPSNAPGMARTPSQASERPTSSLGQPGTPAQNAPAPSHTPISHGQPGQASAASSFVRPVKKSNAIKITDAQGNAVNFTKPSPSPSTAQPQGPVIVSTPNAPTPPPRTPSTQHNRVESKSTKSSEETKNAFAEQVKRQMAETKRLEDEAAAKSKQIAGDQAAAETKQKEDTANAEKAVAKAADEKKSAEDAEAVKRNAETAKKASEDNEAEKKRKEKEEEDERLEREIAEMEAREKEEEEREKAFQEKRAKEKAAAAEREKEKAANEDAELKRQEREAEAREEAREKERNGEKPEAAEPDEESKALFSSLKKPTLGPGATEDGGDTRDASPEADSTPAPAMPARGAGAQKSKPAALKLETNKPVERAEPTPGMQALKSARFLELKEDAKYPDGFKSPNPALNQGSQRVKGRAYDKDFLLQFQNVFKEKPSVDWDQKVKDTLGPGDEPGSARASSARTPSGMTSRSGSGRPAQPAANFGGAMGSFAGPMGARGTTSEQRFMASQGIGGAMPGRAPSSGMGGRTPSSLGMAGATGMSRTNSLQMMSNMGGQGSPRQPSSRGGRGGSKGGDRQHSKRQDHDQAAKMPLTAHMEIAPLEKSTTGWKPPSVSQPAAHSSGPDPSGNMAPDMVQRKVKAALNKMTPEKFDKIADQILDIAAQSKNETDGRTLRQVIQLTFEKACDEAHWAGMYAKFCSKMLTAMSSDIRDETIKDKNGNAVVGGALFRKYLLNRCQEEFERGWEANLPDKPEGETQEAALLSDEYYIAAAAKRRGLGLIQFIGQLYKLRMLTLRIMHECVMRLLNFEGEPDESAIENLVTLLKAVGGSMEEEEKGEGLLNTYFERIDTVILKNANLPSRPRFMVMDLLDLRKAGWKGKDDAKGPKTITQIHEEAEAAQAKAEAERQRTSNRGGGRMGQGRGDARNFSGGMPPPVDYSRTTVGMDDLRRLQARGTQRATGGGLGPGSGNTTRTNTPPVDGKKDEPSTQQNAFSALAALDPSGEVTNNDESEKPETEAEAPAAAEKEETTA